MPEEKKRSSVRDAGWRLLLQAGRITRFLPPGKGFFKLRRFYHRFLPEGFLARKKLDGNLLLDLDVRDNVGLYLWHYPDLYEKKEIEVFCSFITPGCVVLDVGANMGLYTLLAAKRGAQVFAIEADPLNARMLRHNLALNGLEDRVTIFEMAATEAEETVSLYRSMPDMGESNILEKGRLSGSVQGRPIDALNLPPVDVCKMDIEGAELMAIKGMQRTLERSPQMKLLIEYAKAFRDSDALLAYLRTHYSRLQILEAPEADPYGEIPPFCNFLAQR